VDVVKKETIGELEQQIARTNSESMQAALIALKEFVENPGKLSVHIAPETPLSIQQLMRIRDPNRLIETLNLSVAYRE